MANNLLVSTRSSLHQALAGFPHKAVDAVAAFQLAPSPENLRRAVRAMLEHYRPGKRGQSLEHCPEETRLREELGIDSLTLAEAAFKMEDLFDVPMDTTELGRVKTLGALFALLEQKFSLHI